MHPFSYAAPTRTVFRAGQLDLPGRKDLLITTARRAAVQYGYLDRIKVQLEQACGIGNLVLGGGNQMGKRSNCMLKPGGSKDRHGCCGEILAALAAAYADQVGLSEAAAIRLSEGFSVGMGHRETCGSASILVAYAGLAGKGNQAAELLESFDERMGSTICQEILEVHGYRNCVRGIRCAAELLEAHLFTEKPPLQEEPYEINRESGHL